MKKNIKLALICSFLFYKGAAAQIDLAGTWQGKLASSPNEKMTVQFTLAKQANGSYSAVVNSPDTVAIKNIPATAVKFAGGILTIDVASLNGSYSGTVGKGIITGEWKQEGITLPLVLTRYKAPDLSTLKPLLGEWIGEFTPPGATKVTVVFRFEITRDGKLAAFASIPEQGQSGIPLDNVLLENDQVSAKIAGGQAEYTGKLSGTRMDGVIKQGGQEIALNLVKGKYEVAGYSIPASEMKRILGEWAGTTGPNKLEIVFRFETTSEGKLAVFMDGPDQRVGGVAVKNLAMKGDEVTIELPGPAGDTYTGTLSGNSIKGTIKFNKIDQELNLAKGKYRPGINEVPPADMKRLEGEWVGKYEQGGPAYTIVWTFERTMDGKLSAIARAPETGPDAFPITDLSLKGDQLSLRIPATGGVFAGKVDGNTLSGTYKAGGAELRMTITRGAKHQPNK
jgi:hypothetical protein